MGAAIFMAAELVKPGMRVNGALVESVRSENGLTTFVVRIAGGLTRERVFYSMQSVAVLP